MGKVLDSIQREDGKMIYKILMDYNEIRHLSGNMNNIHIFSSNSCNDLAKILERGNHNGTKYFIIPKSIKTKQKIHPCKIMYQKIETGNKILFVYAVEKNYNKIYKGIF